MTAEGREFSDADTAAWFADKALGFDWTSCHFPTWARLFSRYRTVPARLLEIGSWEGRSALFFVNYLPQARLVCIDTFEGSEEHQANPQTFANDLSEIERRFDSNLAPFAGRIEKRKEPSAAALAKLGLEARRFDVIYIDGSHQAADVYSDAALAWPMLEPGGIMLFDDYEWEYMPAAESNPRLGIDAFLQAFKGEYRLIHKAFQLAIEKSQPRAASAALPA